MKTCKRSGKNLTWDDAKVADKLRSIGLGSEEIAELIPICVNCATVQFHTLQPIKLSKSKKCQ